MTATDVGAVGSLARFPVKSMGGELLAEAAIGSRGVEGDRAWAVYTADGGIGSGKTTRRFRRIDGLLGWRAVTDGGRPRFTAPDGRTFHAGGTEADAALTALLGRPLRLASETDVAHHDESPLHLVTTAALGRLADLLGAAELEAERFRANVVLDVPGTGFPEDGWAGRRLALGEDVVLRLGEPMPRCVMVDLADDGSCRSDRVLRLLGEHHGAAFGLQASVERGGVACVGDRARLL